MNSKNILIISHDAGGAQVLSHWVKNHPSNNYAYVLEGPADSIFRENLDTISQCHTLDSAFNKDWDYVITSMSWASSLELNGLIKANAQNINTIVMWDHWVNYKERFLQLTEWQLALPDTFWCPDEYSLKKCNVDFPDTPCEEIPNYYLEAIKKDSDATVSATKNSILYLCEPIAGQMERQYKNPNHLGYTEFSALNDTLDYIRALDKTYSITVRPHPSESFEKYKDIISKASESLQIKESTSRSLLNDIQQHSIIVGCETMAMVVGLTLNKDVYTCIPPTGRPCQLPHRGIKNISELC
jgi:hypothetical protein